MIVESDIVDICIRDGLSFNKFLLKSRGNRTNIDRFLDLINFVLLIGDK